MVPQTEPLVLQIYQSARAANATLAIDTTAVAGAAETFLVVDLDLAIRRPWRFWTRAYGFSFTMVPKFFRGFFLMRRNFAWLWAGLTRDWISSELITRGRSELVMVWRGTRYPFFSSDSLPF